MSQNRTDPTLTVVDVTHDRPQIRFDALRHRTPPPKGDQAMVNIEAPKSAVNVSPSAGAMELP